ncbi:hypothetical protein BDM02DRAFT_3133443 [Thelephora ganbajun]|uniref:Uncharacterized protein n=1 Tax=Thelephora ganbajun TaxID=370292 RepID=A0ACB6YXE1_THEGA|nr:hypothetical protein BDM02DRAFT_3133443 [Thelephora ganbajun]
MWCSTPAKPSSRPGTNTGSPIPSHALNSDVHRELPPPPAYDRKLGLSNGRSVYRGVGLSPTPSSPFSFHALSHGVLDRYDLVPRSFPHHVSSEVGFGDSHSTFSNPDTFATSNFRGFTHHSSYAGDLIFGTRAHQPQQHFEYGTGESGQGLSGIQGIDDIELDAIALQNPSVDLGYDTNTEGALYHMKNSTDDDDKRREYRCTNRSLSVPPPEDQLTISYHRQAPDQLSLAGKIAGASTRNSVRTFEHVTLVQPHQLHRLDLLLVVTRTVI